MRGRRRGLPGAWESRRGEQNPGPGAGLLAGVRREGFLGCQHETVVLTPHRMAPRSGASAAAPDQNSQPRPKPGWAAVIRV